MADSERRSHSSSRAWTYGEHWIARGWSIEGHGGDGDLQVRIGWNICGANNKPMAIEKLDVMLLTNLDRIEQMLLWPNHCVSCQKYENKICHGGLVKLFSGLTLECKKWGLSSFFKVELSSMGRHIATGLILPLYTHTLSRQGQASKVQKYFLEPATHMLYLHNLPCHMSHSCLWFNSYELHNKRAWST
jgi:hypothetical protein